MNEEKPKKPRRSQDEIIADKKRSLARSEWASARIALTRATDALEVLEDCHGAWGERQGLESAFQQAIGAIEHLREAIEAAIPPEGR